MRYDFDTVISRKGTDSLKWNVNDDVLPMWVADMDFKTAPEIMEALAARFEHGIFGYSDVPDAWYDSYILWWKTRHGFELQKEWLIFCTGVIPAISSTVRKLTTPHENVVIQTPVYNIFFNSIINNGCHVLENALLYHDGRYDMDFEDLEAKLADPQTTLMILCNPQNPAGRIWTKEELARVGELCAKHGVTVISDEIHCDHTIPGKEYIPFASVNETCRQCSITCIAPTKSFNIAGLNTAAVSIPNEFLRNRIRRALNTDEVAEPNAFAVTAAVAAFTKGAPWMDALREYLAENRRFACEYIKSEIPGAIPVEAEATYLLWVDVGGLGVTEAAVKSRYGCEKETVSEFIAHELRRITGLFVCEGSEYGTAGDGFLRINLACPRSVVKDGMERLKAGLAAITEELKLKCPYLFFDLDGTLTESGEGITNAAKYAFEQMGTDIPPIEKLYSFVGPPLSESFPRFGVAPDKVDEAVRIFRVYYDKQGWCENVPYPGINDLCRRLRDYGYKLIVATSKRHTQAVRIIEHFGLAPCFTDVIGNDESVGRKTKSQVIEYLMNKHGITDPKNIMMIGDRCYDVEGAAKHGIETVGVTYGYGTREELESAGAAAVVDTVKELGEYLMK